MNSLLEVDRKRKSVLALSDCSDAKLRKIAFSLLIAVFAVKGSSGPTTLSAILLMDSFFSIFY